MKNNYQHYELVGMGHPDKLADWIADMFCQFVLDDDENAKVACEVMGCGDNIFIGGELKTSLPKKHIENIRNKVEVKYKDATKHFNAKFHWNMQKQYSNITQLVEKENDEVGAGDQGICIGYACDETPYDIPLNQKFAHDFFDEWDRIKYGVGKKIDRKIIVTTLNGEIKHLIFATQSNLDAVLVENDLQLVLENLKEHYDFAKDFDYSLSNVWKQGGFKSDTGITGRKIACDNFANCANGGGAFSGKDWTKVDRTGTYYARYLAKNILTKKHLHEVVVKLIYQIGDMYPKVFVNGTYEPRIKPKKLKDIINIYNKYKIDALTDNHWKWWYPWEIITAGGYCEELKDYE